MITRRTRRMAQLVCRHLLVWPLAALLSCSEPPPESLGSAGPEAAASAGSGRPSWPIFRGDSALRGVASGQLPDELTLLWTFRTEEAIASSPAIAEGRVFVGSDDGKVYAVDLRSGEKIWAFATEDIVEAPPLVHDGVVYVGGSDFFFYALDAVSGELKWKHEVDDKILGGANWLPAPDGEGTSIVVGCYDSRLYCFDAARGTLRWAYETDHYVNGTPAVAGERIVFGGCDARLHVVSARGEPLGRIAMCDECHIAGSVAVDGSDVFFGDYGNEFVCVDLEREAVRWRYTSEQFPFFSAPAIGRDRVIFGGRDRQLHCVRREDGSGLWTFRTRRKVDGSPVICGDKVVFGSGDGTLYVLGLEDGRELWSYDIGQSIYSSPAVAQGVIVIGANDGRLYAFGAAP